MLNNHGLQAWQKVSQFCSPQDKVFHIQLSFSSVPFFFKRNTFDLCLILFFNQVFGHPCKTQDEVQTILWQKVVLRKVEKRLDRVPFKVTLMRGSFHDGSLSISTRICQFYGVPPVVWDTIATLSESVCQIAQAFSSLNILILILNVTVSSLAFTTICGQEDRKEQN